ncbi:MAG: dihydrofolate reductase [Rhodocyclaceae bacterium]
MTRPRIALIAAVARNGVIGRDNTLPWRLSDDLKRFKALTLGHPIIMGRKTWDSLGRPLPGRHNIVVSRQAGLQLDGATVVHSLDEALHCAGDAAQVFVIGGAQLYGVALPLADALHLTEVHADVVGDAHFPTLSGFTETTREPHTADERNEFAFDFVDYVRA